MTTTRAIILLLSISLLGACSEPVSHTVTTESEIFTIQERYASMFGPSHDDYFSLTPSKKPEVLWVTAIKANIVGSDGQAPGSPEYFCHSVLARNETQPAVRKKMLGPRFGNSRKMFTLVQGLTEVRFPEGFGMPVLSNDDFISHVMVMNPSEKAEPVQVGVDSNIEYVRESERTEKMKPALKRPDIGMYLQAATATAIESTRSAS